MKLNTILEMLKSFCNSVHKLVLSLLRIVRAYMLVTGDNKAPPRRKRNASILNAMMGWGV
jgi:hypothetical protein